MGKWRWFKLGADTFSTVLWQCLIFVYRLLSVILLLLHPLVCYGRFRLCTQGLSRSIFFQQILSLEILTNLSTSILVTCSSLSLSSSSSSSHPFNNSLDTAGFSDLAFYFNFFCFANYFSWYLHLICFQHLSVSQCRTSQFVPFT